MGEHLITRVKWWRPVTRDDPQCFNYVFASIFSISLFMTLMCAITYWIVKDNRALSESHLNILVVFLCIFAFISFMMVVGKSVHELWFRRAINRPRPAHATPILSFDDTSSTWL